MTTLIDVCLDCVLPDCVETDPVCLLFKGSRNKPQRDYYYKNKVNELIQKYLIRRKFKILCWCVEPEEENNDYGISIGFKKGNILYSVLIVGKDFLFGQFQEKLDSFH